MKLRQLKEIFIYLLIIALIFLVGDFIHMEKFKSEDTNPLLRVIIVYVSYAFVGISLGLTFSKDYIVRLCKNRGKKKTAQWGYIAICAVLLLLVVFEFTRIPALYIILKISSLSIFKIINPYVLDFLLIGFFLPRTVAVPVEDDN